MIGIYKITNKINKKIYYGSSKNIKKRWTDHIGKLKKNKHANILLQRSWNKYGEINFSFEIVELCDIENLHIIEQKYLNKNPDYNICFFAGGGDTFTNNPNKEKIRKKIKDVMHNRYKTMSDDERKKIFSRSLENHPNWKGGISKKNCVCGKKIKGENNYCKDCYYSNRDFSGSKNPFFGKTHSEEYRRASSESRKGKYIGGQNFVIEIDGIQYRSVRLAAKNLKVSSSLILRRLRSDNFSNFKFVK